MCFLEGEASRNLLSSVRAMKYASRTAAVLHLVVPESGWLRAQPARAYLLLVSWE